MEHGVIAFMGRIFVLCIVAFEMMMGGTQIAAALSSSPINLFPNPVEESGPFGRAPPGDHWIWLFVLGPRNYPLPILYISSVPFKPLGLETLVVLPSGSFGNVAKFTESRIDSAYCLKSEHQISRVPGEYTIQVNKHDDGTTKMCVLANAPACKFLSDMKMLRGINWSDEQLQAVHQFGAAIQCDRFVPAN